MQDNQIIIDEAISSLKRHEIDLNLYVDAHHLYIFLNKIIAFTQNFREKIFDHHKIGTCPKLIINEKVYSSLIYEVLSKLERKCLKDFKNDLNSKDSSKHFIEYFDISHLKFSRKKITVQDVLHESQRNIFENIEIKQKPTDIVFINPYINFFMGDDADITKVLNGFKRQLRYAKSSVAKNRIHEFIKFYSNTNNHNNEKETEEIKKIKQRNEQHTKYKSAIINFNNSWKDLVSELNEGVTRFDIHPSHNYMIRFQEKGVDAKLIIAAIDDLARSNNNTFFSILTNDTDYFPIFEKIIKNRELYWLCGENEKKMSGILKKIVPENRQFLLEEIYIQENGYIHLPYVPIWEEQLNEAMKNKLTLDYSEFEMRFFEAHRHALDWEEQKMYDDYEY